MNNKVIDYERWKRARLDGIPNRRRARPTGPQGGAGFVSIGIISAELIRRLMERE